MDHAQARLDSSFDASHSGEDLAPLLEFGTSGVRIRLEIGAIRIPVDVILDVKTSLGKDGTR